MQVYFIALKNFSGKYSFVFLQCSKYVASRNSNHLNKPFAGIYLFRWKAIKYVLTLSSTISLHVIQRPLKENSRIYNCFKYCNLFFVSVTPPEKKNHAYRRRSTAWSGSRLWLKRQKKCRITTRWERVTQLSGQHTWHVMSNGRLRYNEGMPLIPWKTRTAQDNDPSNYLCSYFIPHPSVNYLKNGKHPPKSILCSFHLSLHR